MLGSFVNILRTRAGLAILRNNARGSLRGIGSRAYTTGKGTCIPVPPAHQALTSSAVIRYLESRNVFLPTEVLSAPSVLPSEVLFGKSSDGGKKKSPSKTPGSIKESDTKDKKNKRPAVMPTPESSEAKPKKPKSGAKKLGGKKK